MFGKTEGDGDGQEFYLCEWTRYTISSRDMKLVRHGEELMLRDRERGEGYGRKWCMCWLCRVWTQRGWEKAWGQQAASELIVMHRRKGRDFSLCREMA